jgi:hypothetical protein
MQAAQHQRLQIHYNRLGKIGGQPLHFIGIVQQKKKVRLALAK